MKRKLTFFVAALMAMSCFSVTSYAANFSDINDAPWEGAKTYINSVADLGLMIGDIDPNNGKTRFRPKDKVTYCETTQLAYMALKNTNSLIPSTENLSTKWSQVLKSNNIPTWAYDCVAYALENNIISLYDVSRFMTKNGSKISDNYASRESVAVVFGKSLAHRYAVDEGASLKYKDAGSISSTSVPYVDLLSRLGILVGDTDNNFTPKTYINRAEMAVLVSKDYDVLKNGNANVPSGGGTTNGGTSNGGTSNGGATATTEVTGTVVSMEDYGGNKMLTVLTSTSQKLGFIVNETTYTIDGRTSANTQISALSLKAGDGVKVNYTGSQINVLTLTSSTANTTTSTVKGTVDDITNDKIYLVKSSTTGSSDFYYYDTTFSITLDGDKATLKQLFDEFDDGGLDVELSLNSSQKVVAIKATSDTSGDVKGTLKDIDKDEVKIKKSGSSSTKTYEWANNPKITYDGKTISSVSKMIDEYEDTSKTITVSLYLNSKDEITKMVAKKGSSSNSDDDVIVGKLRDLTSSEVEVRNSDNNKTETYDLADNIKYKWEGSSVDRRDIVDEMDDDTVYVELTLNDDDEVKTLKASNDEDDFDSSSSSSSKRKKTGILLSVDKDEIKMDEDDDGKEYYDMPDDYEDDVEYRLDGKSSTYKKVRDAVKDYDEVTAKVYLNSDKEVTKIDAETDDDSSSSSSSSKKGEIKKLTRGNITVGSSSNSYELISNVSVTIDGDNSYDINDLIKAFGDSRKFEAKLTVEHSIVTKIAAYTIEVDGELTSLNTSKEKIFIETRDGEELSFEYEEDDVKVKMDGDREDIDYLKDRMDKYTYDATLTIEDGIVTEIDAER